MIHLDLFFSNGESDDDASGVMVHPDVCHATHVNAEVCADSAAVEEVLGPQVLDPLQLPTGQLDHRTSQKVSVVGRGGGG